MNGFNLNYWHGLSFKAVNSSGGQVVGHGTRFFYLDLSLRIPLFKRLNAISMVLIFVSSSFSKFLFNFSTKS